MSLLYFQFKKKKIPGTLKLKNAAGGIIALIKSLDDSVKVMTKGGSASLSNENSISASDGVIFAIDSVI